MHRGRRSADSRIATTSASADASSVHGMPSPMTCAGSGVSVSSASTMTPSVPSLPMNQSTGSCANAYPAVFLSRPDRPTWVRSPFASTISSERTCARVAPYSSVRAPDALHATAPPMVTSSSLVGSGAKWSPVSAIARFRSPSRTPGWTTARLPSRSTSRIRSIARTDSSTPLSVMDAPVVLVCPPAAVTEVRSLAALRSVSCTSSVVVGRATASGSITSPETSAE